MNRNLPHPTFSPALRAAIADAITAATTGGSFVLYSGTPPRSPVDPTMKPRLAQLEFEEAQPATAEGTWRRNAFTRRAPSSGVATWGRASNAAGEPLFDLPIDPLEVEKDNTGEVYLSLSFVQ